MYYYYYYYYYEMVEKMVENGWNGWKKVEKQNPEILSQSWENKSKNNSSVPTFWQVNAAWDPRIENQTGYQGTRWKNKQTNKKLFIYCILLKLLNFI